MEMKRDASIDIMRFVGILFIILAPMYFPLHLRYSSCVLLMYP